eukprot:246312-Prymnesium_polylepis.2
MKLLNLAHDPLRGRPDRRAVTCAHATSDRHTRPRAAITSFESMYGFASRSARQLKFDSARARPRRTPLAAL